MQCIKYYQFNLLLAGCKSAIFQVRDAYSFLNAVDFQVIKGALRNTKTFPIKRHEKGWITEGLGRFGAITRKAGDKNRRRISELKRKNYFQMKPTPHFD